MNDFDLTAPGMEAMKAAVEAHDLPAAQKAYLDYRRTASTAKWIIMPSDEPATPLAKSEPLADDVTAHKIHNLWYDAVQPKIADLGPDFDWFRNPFPAADPHAASNWHGWLGVLARTQFWEQLAGGYWMTRDEKYARAWVEQLTSFATKIPVDFTNNDQTNFYWNPLAAANRMFESWPYAYYHFLNSPSFTPEANWLYTKEARDHANILLAGLNDPHRTGNWITAECCGLYTLGVLYPELKESAQWRQVAMDRFGVEIVKLVPPDGFEAELSPGYDTSTMEQFTVPTQLAPLNHLPLPDVFRDRLISMYKALVLVMDQSGNVVPTNDSWVINAATLAPRGLKLGDDPLLEWAASRGRQGTAPPDSTMLPYAGFYAMRSGWKLDDLFLFFRGGPIGIGHQHEEDLEIVLRAWNKTLLYDPGTFTYDQSEMRRYVLGTSSHSTVLVDGKWQHAGSSPVPTAPVANPWVTTPLFDYVASTFDHGYQENDYAPHAGFNPMKWVGTLDPSITHTRRVLYLRPFYALVVDTLDGTGAHTFDNLFQLDAPAATIDPSTHAVVSQRPDGVQLALVPLEQEGLTAHVVVGHKDPPIAGWFPMQNRATATVDFQKQQEAPAIFATFLDPFQGTTPPAFQAQALPVQGDQVWSQAFTTPQEKAEVVLVKDNKTEPLSITSSLAGAVQVTAAGWTLREPAGGTQVWQGGWGVQSYQDTGTAFTLDQPASLVFGKTANGLVIYNGGDAPRTVSLTQPLAMTASLAPGAGTEISAQGAAPATTAPSLFPPFLANTSLPSYADYVKARPARAVAAADSLKIKAADFTLISPLRLLKKWGVDDPIITKWIQAGAQISAPVTIPQSGWYNVTLHYCSGGGTLVSLLINGQVPFAEAEAFPLQSTLGAPPSDGWSNVVSDWHDFVLGSDVIATGWKVYLPAGANQIALRQEGGSGANLAWLILDPARP